MDISAKRILLEKSISLLFNTHIFNSTDKLKTTDINIEGDKAKVTFYWLVGEENYYSDLSFAFDTLKKEWIQIKNGSLSTNLK